MQTVKWPGISSTAYFLTKNSKADLNEGTGIWTKVRWLRRISSCTSAVVVKLFSCIIYEGCQGFSTRDELIVPTRDCRRAYPWHTIMWRNVKKPWVFETEGRDSPADQSDRHKEGACTFLVVSKPTAQTPFLRVPSETQTSQILSNYN